MRITRQLEDFIRSKVDAKIAPVLGEQEYEDTVSMCEQWGADLTEKVNTMVRSEFDAFVKAHPELEGAELSNSLERFNKLHIRYAKAVFSNEMEEKRKLRSDYVDEVCQRVCIDATQCKDTADILQLIDKIIK